MTTIENEIVNLVDDIIADYDKGRSIDKINTFSQPDKEVVIDIVNKLQKIIFSGYFKNKSYHSYTLKNNVTMLLEDVLYNLCKQISLVLKYSKDYKDLNESSLYAESQKIALTFLKKIPHIREYIETDVQAAFEGDPAAFNKEEIIISYPGLYAIFINRIAHELYKLSVPLIPRMMTEYAHSKTGIDIHPGAEIGKYFFIDHGTGIVIGDNVKVYQGVTLGALSTRGGQKLKNKKRHPTIEDNVTIYSGASILGGETVVGKDVVVGGNAFITKSIQAGARVSIKNQELSCNYDAEHPVERAELEQDESWYYII